MTKEEFTARYMAQFSEQQRQAVMAEERAVLLLAVPGSGKTTVLVTRLGYMALCRGIDPASILTMTYTTAATREMRERFAARFPELAGRMPQFRTINGLSSKIIAYSSRSLGPAFSLQENAGELAQLVGRIYREKNGEYPTDSTIRDIRTAITYCKNRMLTQEEIRAQRFEIPGFAEIYARYCAALRAARQMDYDDQMRYALAILRKQPEVLAQFQAQYPYLCVDESQDTSRVQHAIIALLTGETGSLFMVGDEDQSIYGFRAADPEALMRFSEMYPGAKVLFLEENYRSTPQIVQLAGRFVARNHSRYPKTLRPTRPDGPAVQLVHAQSRQTQIAYLYTLAQQTDTPFAVLYRNNDSALPLIDLFERSGTPYCCRSYDDTFFSHRILADVADIIHLAYAPEDTEAFLRVYYKFGAPISKEVSLAACARSARTHESVWQCVLKQTGLSAACRDAVGRLQALLAALPNVPGGELIAMIWGPIGYGQFVAARRLDTGKFSILQMLAAREQTPEDFLLRLAQLRQIVQTHENPPQANVTLSTIHSSKGLEYPSVYLLDVHDGVLPARADAAGTTQQERQEYEEDRRLFYVAMTRAKDRLYLFEYPDVPSAFMQEVRVLLPAQTCPAEEFASILPENACGRRYMHRTDGPGTIAAQCGDTMLVCFASGSWRLMEAGQMLLERDRTPRPALPDADEEPAPAAVCTPGQAIFHKKYGPGRVLAFDGALVTIRFDADRTTTRQFNLQQSLAHGFLQL